MNLKTAILFGIIGAFLVLVFNLIFLTNSIIEPYEIMGVKSYYLEMLPTIGMSMILVFFIMLYQKNK